ncbi:MAG: Rid family detoxifying hydrolase [Halieaceae bacterium]
MPRPIGLVALVLMLGTSLLAVAQAPEFLNSGKLLPADLPFSEAVRSGDTLYLSGQVGIKPGTMQLVSGGLEAEARQTLANIELILSEHGYALGDLVKCTVMLADMKQWGSFNAVYRDYLKPPYPARSAFGASGLALGARVEMECIAVKSGSGAGD